jgi:hypothetical protein
MRDPCPTDLINLETGHIPFKYSNMDTSDWIQTFRSWLSVTPGWRNWYLRMSALKRIIWDEDDIGQCIDLSLSTMTRNESMLIAASHFWSNTLNAFLFGRGPMTPTLADVLMLTGLNISTIDSAFSFLAKPSHRLETKNVGGWNDYVKRHAKTGPIGDREHTTFLNMWLEKFIFCGKTVGPTTNMQTMAESLASRHMILLGKHLLGSVYSLLHHVSVKLSTG